MAGGGRVAFHVLGTGPAVAMLFPYHVNHLALNWRVPLHRGATQFLARQFTVINLDFPGAGLSRPFKGRLELRALSAALEAVRRAVGVERWTLCAMGAAGLIACDYAARQPQHVARLVLIATGESDANRHLLHLRRRSPDVEAELRGALLGGVGDTRNSRALAAVARQSLSPARVADWERMLGRKRLLSLARRVSVPVLYVHAASDRLVPHSAAQALIEKLRHGTLHVVAATSGMDVWRKREAVREIARFVEAADESPRARRSSRRPRRDVFPAGLSAREVEVIRLLAVGRTSRQIADDLFISLNTVSYHLRNIFAKIGVSNRTAAAAFAYESGIASRG
jgi:DNA-binding CsgD family transcriptional regulator/pimeloyl-ACP methyl ester carboxylesterase